MEKREENIIKKNMTKLIKLTRCTTIFITGLSDVLGQEESQDLLGSRERNFETAYKLYEILKTRTGAFAALKQALVETNQTGVLAILEQASELQEIYGLYKCLRVTCNTPVYPTPNTISIHKGQFGTRTAKLKVFRDTSEENMKQAINEIEILKKIDWHENIVRCYIAKHVPVCFNGESKKYFSIVLDYETHLKYFLTKEVSYQSAETEWLLKQICNGIAFLHSAKILHLNLKLESIFVNRPGAFCTSIKIGEFGVAHQLKPDEIAKKVFLRTVYKTAVGDDPKVLSCQNGMHDPDEMDDKEVILTFSNDVFCLGIVIYQILSGGKHPFGDINVRKWHIRNNTPVLQDEYFNVLNKQNFMRLISVNPSDRPDVTKEKLF